MPDAGTVLDVKWRFACHQAAASRVLTQRALSVQSREVYRLATVEGLSNNAAAKRLGMSAAAVRMSAAAVRMVRSRVERMVAAIEESLFR